MSLLLMVYGDYIEGGSFILNLRKLDRCILL